MDVWVNHPTVVSFKIRTETEPKHGKKTDTKFVYKVNLGPVRSGLCRSIGFLKLTRKKLIFKLI